MKIGMALSGGGFRALVFHLGVLARLSSEKKLEEINFLSSVSGGSLCVALVMAQNKYEWPSSKDYADKVLPKVREILITQGLDQPILKTLFKKMISTIFRRGIKDGFGVLFETRADDMAAAISNNWNIKANLTDLKKEPRWAINATCFETGKNWRFERFRIGDYFFGYTYDSKFPLSEAVAASSAFPALIGPLEFSTANREWFNYVDYEDDMEDEDKHRKRKTKKITPQYETVRLWDGGAYDNLGLEKLHNYHTGWPFNDFLLVSDASGLVTVAEYKKGVTALFRLITGIMKNQIRSHQSRAIFERIRGHKDQGAVLRTGKSVRQILEMAQNSWNKNAIKLSNDEIGKLSENTLSEEEAKQWGNLKTEISKLKTFEFDKLFQHGFEVADATLHAYNSGTFAYVGFQNTQWASPSG